ncbi:23 kDa integral membrane protein [Drosophila tropicalis]|uniref:23 kDa integral membrane protein n=1 Tax=Drosophila tropicalis TaxID=46794 RepID=UPI0035ABB7D0
MEKSFSISPWKYALFATCILIVGCNIFFFSCGVVTWGSASSVYGSYAVALCGISVFAAAFLGVYVALKESYKYSIYYLLTTILVMGLLTTYFLTFSSTKDQLMTQFEERIQSLFDAKTHHLDTMQPIHSLFRCCGLQGPQDYLSEQNEGQGALPASCCYSFDCTNPSHVFQEGCSTKATGNLKLQAEINYYACVAIFCLEFLGLLTAFFMGKARKHAKTKIKDDESPINNDD